MRGEGKKLAQVARLWARGQLLLPTPGQSHADADEVFDEALAALGFCRVEDEDDEADSHGDVQGVCYLWPCNVPVFNLWRQLDTQWRVGTAGRTGLDYASVIAYMQDVARIKPRVWNETFAGLRAMEVAALNVWVEMRA